MPRIPGLKRLVRIERGTAGVERAVDDELQFHFDMTMRDLMANGMNADDARRETERRFGDVNVTRARLAAIDRTVAHRERRADWWSGAAQDLRYALRGVRRKPGFALAVVLTLGLGIGANATMFGIVDRLLFRPPAYLTNADRVHRLYFARMSDGKEFFGGQTQYQRFLDVTAAAKTLEGSAAYAPRQIAVGTGDDARDASVGGATASIWKLFDAKPVIGRFYNQDEDLPPNGAKVAVLSYSFWQSRYAGAPSVLGTKLRIGPSEYTIIGVAPAHFSAMAVAPPIAFIPLTAAGDDAYQNAWVQCRTKYCLTWIEMYARAKPGVALTAITADLDHAYHQSYLAQIATNPRLTPIDIAKPHVVVASVLSQRGPNQAADTRVAVWLLGVAGVVLLIACANVGNLLLGRALRRRREIAVRIALGVSRGRLLRQLLLESLVLATLGGVAGLAFAQWGGQLLRVSLMPKVEWTSAVADPRVALFAAAVAIGAGLLCGLAPAFHARRTDVAGALKAGAREGSPHRSRLRATLLVLQAGLSVMLLIGAGLFVRSVRNVGNVHFGYDADRLLWVEASLRGTTLDSAAKIALRNQLLGAAQRDPAVAQAAAAVSVPFFIEWNSDLYVSGIDSVQRLGEFFQQQAGPTFFATTGTRILRGRGITADDRHGAPLAMVVSDAMAKKLWPGQDAIGKCVRLLADTAPCSTVVGVAENIKQASLGDDPGLTYYQSFDQTAQGLAGMFVRTRGSAEASTEGVRRHLQQVMPGTGYVTVTPMTDMLASQERSWELGATMFAVFGSLALVLAGIGLYGVIAFSVAERTHEMGVRIALGARVANVVSLIVRDALRVVLAGLGIGLAISLAAGRWVAPLLFQVSPRDPVVFGAVTLVLVCVAVAASWIPAVRASRVDPSMALRAD